jgi:hypothetical protein
MSVQGREAPVQGSDGSLLRAPRRRIDGAAGAARDNDLGVRGRSFARGRGVTAEDGLQKDDGAIAHGTYRMAVGTASQKGGAAGKIWRIGEVLVPRVADRFHAAELCEPGSYALTADEALRGAEDSVTPAPDPHSADPNSRYRSVLDLEDTIRRARRRKATRQD